MRGAMMIVGSSSRRLQSLAGRSTWAWALAVLVVGSVGCLEGSVQAPRSAPTPVSVSAAVLVEDDAFVAYFGDDHFDLEQARAEDAEFGFVAIRGPLDALDGSVRTVILSEPAAEAWAISYNLVYGAGETIEWAVLRFVPGQDGLSGVVRVIGDAEEDAGVVSAYYQLGFAGMMNLPVVGDANLGISIQNAGGPATELER